MTDGLDLALSDILDEALDGIAVLSPGGSDGTEAHIVRANVRFRLMTGLGHLELPVPLEEAVGGDAPLWTERLLTVVGSGRAVSADMVWRVAGQVMRLATRTVPAADGVVVTLTESQRDAARRSALRIVHLLDIAPDLRLTVRRDGQVVAASPFALDQLGDVIDRPFISSLHARYQRVWNDQVIGAVESHRLWNGELVFEPVPGYTIPCLVTAVRNSSLVEVLGRDNAQIDEWTEHLSSSLGSDPDTGLINRHAVFDEIELALTRLRAGASSLAVVSIVSQAEVLARSDAKALGSALASVEHSGVRVGRTGPRSFVLFSEDALAPGDLRTLAGRIHDRARESLGDSGVAVGAVRAGPGDRADHLVATADRAAEVAGPSSGVFVVEQV